MTNTQTLLPDGSTEIRMVGAVFKTPYESFAFSEHSMESQAWIKLCDYEIVALVPADFNIVAAEVASLQKQIDNETDEFYQKKRVLEEKIANLLALPAPASFSAATADDIPF